MSWEASSATGSVFCVSLTVPGYKMKRRTVSHSKVDIQHSDQAGVALDDLSNALTSKGLFPKPSLNLVEDFGVVGVGLVKGYRESVGGNVKK